jgi:capsular exopolysaccharide synthesis family protein
VIHQIANGTTNSVVISSCQPGEGKTTGALNLGISLAVAGLKVIVVETDMRRPTFKNYSPFLGKALANSESEGVGIAQLLDPHEGNLTSRKIKDAIIVTTLENLALLPCPRLPENPAELLEGARIRYLVQYLEKEYDIVLFDTPPSLAVIDSIALTRLIKNVYLIVHAGKTSKRDFLAAKESFRDIQVELSGVILNKVPKHKLGSDYGYSYSGYNYTRYSYTYKSNAETVNNLKDKSFKMFTSLLSNQKNKKPNLLEKLPKISLSKRATQSLSNPTPLDRTKFIQEE